MAGPIVTFYSYKGGVGRSFALANIAVILAQWGARVLTVDWDIEAPGLNHYFADYTGNMKAGVLDFLQDCASGSPGIWSDYVSEVEIPNVGGKIQLMPAGAGGGSDYTSIVQGINWDDMFTKHALGAQLETMRAGWVAEFDLILVDSRTGVTDFSGLTTAQLPDVLAFMFTANSQSLKGSIDIARRAMEARRRMPLDRPAILPLPIPARFEQREEYDRAQVWRSRFAADLAPFFDTWVPRGIDPFKLIDLLTIPYVPRWTFGEELAALFEPAGSSGTRAPTGQAASYALETLAALLIQGFAKVDLLVSSRDEYVHAARSRVQSRRLKSGQRSTVFISSSRADGAHAEGVSRHLAASLRNALDEESRVFFDAHDIMPGFDDLQMAFRQIEEATAYIVIVGPNFLESTWQQSETELIQRQSLRSDPPKMIIPIVLKGGEGAFERSRLANYNTISVNPAADLENQLAPVIERLRRQLSVDPIPTRVVS
jgi:hypothetical protein